MPRKKIIKQEETSLSFEIQHNVSELNDLLTELSNVIDKLNNFKLKLTTVERKASKKVIKKKSIVKKV
jgi:hypothetical protein